MITFLDAFCWSHDECNSESYCATNNVCYKCVECTSYDDAVDGTCPDCAAPSVDPTEAPTSNAPSGDSFI